MKYLIAVVTILVLFLGLLLAGWRSGTKKQIPDETIIFSDGVKPVQFLSIQQIDSITAATNIRFARYQN
ncbi:MAG TPA: hypothetical protein VH917_02835 [Ignavibacteriaceae bacterium]|jgi:hypothetical protein